MAKMMKRAKYGILHKLYEQFQTHGLTTDITYEEYVAAVGATEAVDRRDIKNGWMNRWERCMNQLLFLHSDVNDIINTVQPTLKVEDVKEAEPKLSGLEALK